jgi:predicted alpha/beta superfamily hydrolase
MMVILLLISWNNALAGEKTEVLSAEVITINSKILDEVRFISIYLPENYGKDKERYPVLYLLDGKTHFQHSAGAVNYLAKGGVAPEMIVVSIHNVDRNRDFSPVHVDKIPTSGGADKFLGFLSEELTKYIDKKYRTSGFSILAGHSFGGLFTIYTMLNDPSLFNAYIAISPYLQYADEQIISEAEQLLQSGDKLAGSLYMTIGDEPGYFPVLQKFSDLLTAKTGNSIDFSYVKMENEDHTTIPYLTVFNGLRYIFSDWRLPAETFVKGMEDIDDHYKKVSDKYGMKVRTPETVLNQLGYYYLRNDDPDNAIGVFEENVKRYPKSANVYDSLGEAYETKGLIERAKENYQKACDLGALSGSPFLPVYQENLSRVNNMLTSYLR